MTPEVDARFAALRERLEPELAAPAVLVVTSALAGDGASFLADGLAHAFASGGTTVGLVAARSYRSAVAMHPLPDVAAGALQNRDVRSFVRDMRARFALTIIAAPPLRAGSGTLLFARWADRVLLGIRLGRVAEDEDHVLPVELRHLGARVAGIVPVSPTTIARMPCNPISTST